MAKLKWIPEYFLLYIIRISIRIRTNLFDNAVAVITTFKLKLFNTHTKCWQMPGDCY